MSAFTEFVMDMIIPVMVILAIIVWVKRSLFNHDAISEYVKTQNGKLVAKDWYTRSTRGAIKAAQNYYIIKYYDKDQRLHRVQLTVGDTGEITIEKESIID